MPNKKVDAELDAEPSWLAAKNEDAYGMGILHFVNDTDVTWRWFESKTGTVLDEVHLSRKH
jgi:hypothetical protein